jgi:hypothetical protein
MKVRTLALPTGALALGALLLSPTESVGWTTAGGAQTIFQRDVRVYNNFTDNGANNNTTPDPDFPGYVGAELAIWKATIEWGSELHGSGEGDPHQPGGLGSGGANFDATWQGTHTFAGTSNDNVHSEITGNGGSTYAYTETPIHDGWRIRYYKNPWNWKDGPNEIATGVCIQGVATHEYGHAIGLGHSLLGGATMFASINANGNEERSLNADDKAGLQALYGVRDTLTKPSITGVEGGAPLTITGVNFDATGNEVWFTQAGSGGDGEPVKALGVSSSQGGTKIVIATPPPNAGPGDVLVRTVGSAFTNLSNAWPWDPNAVACSGGATSYCTAGTSASGCLATLGTSGTPSATSPSGFVVTASGVEGDKDGLYYFGVNGQQASPWGNGTSYQCVTPPVTRAGILSGSGTPGACDGTFAQDLNALWSSNPVKNPGEGATVECQLWYRDPLNTGNQTTGLSNALSFVVCP